MKNTMRKAMLSTIAMLVVAVMSLTGVTYAWFSSATEAEVTGMTMNIGTAGMGLQVAKADADGKAMTYGSTVDFAFEGQEGDAKLQPVSTVDGINFFTASVSVDDANDIISIAADSSRANVWQETFYLRNTGTNTLNVKITADVFADNSQDTSFEAARIAIFKGTGKTAELIDTNLVAIYGDETSYYGLASVPSSYTNADGEYIYKVDTKDETVVADVTSKFTNDYSTITLQAPGYDNASNTQGEQAYTILVWLEGQDAQAGNDAALSSFKVNLSLSAQQ